MKHGGQIACLYPCIRHYYKLQFNSNELTSLQSEYQAEIYEIKSTYSLSIKYGKTWF